MNKRKYATKNFKWTELQCKCGCRTAYISTRALAKLQLFRELVGKSIIINSCCRCSMHNARVGGVPKSKHRSTRLTPTTAFDISIRGHRKAFLIECAEKAGFAAIGVNYKTFIHVDDRQTTRRIRW